MTVGPAQAAPAETQFLVTRPALVPAFLEETGALLGKIETAMPGLEGAGSAEVLRSVLRLLHTLKGAAGLLGFAQMSGLAHHLESYLSSQGPGAEARLAVHQGAAIFRALLAELEMSQSGIVRISPELVARCEELRAELVRGTSGPAKSAPRDGEDGKGFPQEWIWNDASSQLPAANAPERAAGVRPPALSCGRSPGFLRVEAGKLERLMELLEQWEEAHANLAEAARTGVLTSFSLYRDLSRLYVLGERLRLAGLSLKRTSLRRSFQKVEWLVQDLAPRLGKRVELEQHGAEVEVDISVAQELDTVLLHLARNALEHGLESPDERGRAGKDARGVLRLSAQGFEEALVLELTDDGRGFDRKAILAQAVARNLLPRGMVPPDGNLLSLAFAPGLSTARELSENSGRGLGLDIVRRTVEKMGGVLEVNSEAGKGTTFQVYLPCGAGHAEGEVSSQSPGSDSSAGWLRKREESLEDSGRGRLTRAVR